MPAFFYRLGRGARGRGLEARARTARFVAAACLLAALASGCHGAWIQPAFRGPERTLRTRHFRIVTDASAASLVRLAEAAEGMQAELERLLPVAPGPREPTRALLAFRDVERFKRYLGDHFFADGRAIGFYCDLGGEIALPWSDPPTPEDVRVLRHEVAHQHLAARLRTRLPAWLEEGLAERLALGAGMAPETPPRWGEADLARLDVPPGAARAPARLAVRLGMRETLPAPAPPTLKGWTEYEQHRARLDAVFASLSLPDDAASWEAPDAVADEVPEPRWADSGHGYVLHLQFIRFIEAQTGALPGGALGAVLVRARDGAPSALDLAGWFPSLGALDRAFHDYVRRAGLHALVEGAGDPPELELGEPDPDLLPASGCLRPLGRSHLAPSSEELRGDQPASSSRKGAQRP